MSTQQLTIGQAKRVLEWWCSSATFRRVVAEDTRHAAELFNLDFDPELVRPLWDESYAGNAAGAHREPDPVVKAYRAYFREKTQWSKDVRDGCAPDDARIRAWRARQVARNVLENGPFSGSVIHAPFALELSDGCSVGCWFCGVGATRYLKSWLYSPDNAALWADILHVFKEKVGAASKWGFGYWATDPLDNPDYEKFMGDFADILGMYPQTTTAQAQKHPERVRRLLRISEERGCKINRFSVISESILRQIHAAFTPEEMTNVEIVGQMKTSTVAKAYAGSFRASAKEHSKLVSVETRKVAEMLGARPSEGGAEDDDFSEKLPQPGTIACISGFLVNMIHRTIKLISPCRASDQWPLGYIVYDQATFDDADDVARLIDKMVAEHMPVSLTDSDRISLVEGCTLKPTAAGFQIMSALSGFDVEQHARSQYLRELGGMVADGTHPVGHIKLSGLFRHGIPEETTGDVLTSMFDRGVLTQSPQLYAS